MKTRTPSEIQAATDEVYSRMTHQPRPRFDRDAPTIDLGSCTNPRCSSHRCSCSRRAAR